MYRANRPQTAELLGILLAPFECRDGITLAVVGSMNQPRMTLTNESVTFTADGIWIQPLLSDRFRFAGTPADLINIMIEHHELDIVNTRFRVRA